MAQGDTLCSPRYLQSPMFLLKKQSQRGLGLYLLPVVVKSLWWTFSSDLYIPRHECHGSEPWNWSREMQAQHRSPRCWGCLSQWEENADPQRRERMWRAGVPPCQQLPHPFPQGLRQGLAPHGGSSGRAAQCSHLPRVTGSWTEAHLCNPGEEQDLVSLLPASCRDVIFFGKTSQSKGCRTDQFYLNAQQSGTLNLKPIHLPSKYFPKFEITIAFVNVLIYYNLIQNN